MGRIKQVIALTVLSTLTALLIACGGKEASRELDLLDSQQTENWRLRKAQMVRVVDRGNPDETVVHLMDREQFRELLFEYCEDTLGTCNDRSSRCGQCDALMEVCLANTYLELAGIRSRPLHLDGGWTVNVLQLDANGDPIGDPPETEPVTVEDWEIGPQSNATNAHLATLGATSALEAMRVAASNLGLVSGIEYGDPDSQCDDTHPPPPEPVGVDFYWPKTASLNTDTGYPVPNDASGYVPGDTEYDSDLTAFNNKVASGEITTIGRVLASTFAEGYSLLQEAAGLATDNVVAAADAQLVSPSRQQGREARYGGLELSRLAAASRLAGGGFPHAAEVPDLCASEPPKGPAMAALEALRNSGIAPSVISNDSIPIGELVNGITEEGDPANVSGGDVRTRLKEVWQRDELGEPGLDLFEHLGVSQRDFEVARDYLRDELETFQRSEDALADDPAGVTLTFDRFAATVNPPDPLPDAFYTRGVRGGVVTRWFIEQQNPNPLIDALGAIGGLLQSGQAWDYAGQIDAAVSIAARILESTSVDPVVAPQIESPLAGIVVQGQEERQGRLELCMGQATGLAFTRFMARGFSPEDEIAIVRGEDGLRCAVEGHVEGDLCTTEELGITALPATTDQAVEPPTEGYAVMLLNKDQNTPVFDTLLNSRIQVGSGFNSVAWNFIDGHVAGLGERLYFVKLKEGNSEKGEPGAYTVLGGVDELSPGADAQ